MNNETSSNRGDSNSNGNEDLHNQDRNQNQVYRDFRYPYERPSKPAGVSFVGKFFKFSNVSSKRTFHKALVLCITFVGYMCFHMGRRPLSIVKNVLNRNCSSVHNVTLYDEKEDITYIEYESSPDAKEDPTWCDWEPFNDDATANQLLAQLDSAFLFSYAFFMFFSGFMADRCNLRYFLSAGLILSGLLLYAFGLAFYFNIHSMTYFITIQILSGIVQTAGWPCVVTSIGHWFDQSSRGAIFGVWNSNTNFGNILGATIAGYFVERAWGLSFIVPGFIMLGAGVLIFLFFVPKPDDVGLPPIKNSPKIEGDLYSERDVEQAVNPIIDTSIGRTTNRRKLSRSPTEEDLGCCDIDDSQTVNNSEQSPLINDTSGDEVEYIIERQTVSFWVCLKIPGVIEYSLSLGFAKLVSYTFLYWLPRYITQSTLNNSEDSAYLSVPFDIGGIVGAIIAGYLSDKYKKSALTCTVMLLLACPAMLIFERFGALSNVHNILLQLLTGALVTGPYSLITTAVSTDLGSRIKDGKAMATVAAIIDGTGSIGAAIGPLFAGYVSDSGWTAVFIMLILSDLIASLCLTRVTLKELNIR